MRRTASSRRAIGISPDCAASSVLLKIFFQLFGAMYMSTPALSAAGQRSLLQPGTWPWPVQSPTTKPSKPMRPFRIVVSSGWWPCILVPFQLEYDAITVSAPASIAPG